MCRRYRRGLHHRRGWSFRCGIRCAYKFVLQGMVNNQRDRVFLTQPPTWRSATPFRDDVDRHGYILTSSFADKLAKVPWLAVNIARNTLAVGVVLEGEIL